MQGRRTEIRTSLSTDAGRLARVEEVIADVTHRLRAVCSSLPENEFTALMRRIAEVTVKYEALVEMRSSPRETPPHPHVPLANTEGRIPSDR